jgi:hypothetical protein
VQDFRNEGEAMKAADRLIEKNVEEFGHDGASNIDEVMPLLSRFRYIEGKGKKRSWQQTQEKKLKGTGNIKGIKDLEKAKSFMEALGPVDEDGETPPNKVVSTSWEKANTASLDMRTAFRTPPRRRSLTYLITSRLYV